MKKIYYFSLVFLIIISSCRSLNLAEYKKPPQFPVDSKILPLLKNDEQATNKWLSGHIDNNICELYGDKYGYIIIKSDFNTDKKAKGLLFLGMCGLLTPLFLGLPTCYIVCNASIEMEIQNSKKETISKFVGEGKAITYIAMWWGYNEENAYAKAQIDAGNMAFKKIKEQLTKNVVEGLNKKLKDKGKI